MSIITVRVNQIFNDTGVSTILVIGSSSEYLSVADNVILMNEYIALNATTEAKEMCKNNTVIDVIKDANWYFKHHKVYSEGFTPYPNGSNTERLEVSDRWLELPRKYELFAVINEWEI